MRRLLKAFKTEIAPTKEQKVKIIRSIGVARFLYNQYIAYNRRLYKMFQRGQLDEKQKHFVTANDFDKYVNHKLKIELTWINQCGSKSRKKALVNAEQAFRRYFSGVSGFPNFKKKANQDVKLYFPKNNKGDWAIWRHKLMIPTLKQVRLKEFGYLPVGVKVTNGTISYMAGRFYVSVVVDIDEKSKHNKDLEASYHKVTDGVGIDLGVKDLAIVSDGKIFKNINKSSKVKGMEKRLRREQRCLSRKYKYRKKKGGKTATASANIEKQKLKVQKLHQRITRIREDYENKTIHEIVKQKPRFITVEDLNVKGMMKNRHLAKAVAAQRFNYLLAKLKRKAEIIGIEFREVDRFYPSSKTCHVCGHIHKGLKLKDRVYVCPECGYTADRDFNASLNLRDAKEYRIA
ncbi:RNA-guided endonuclease TnpB family protein [Selenomonas ruminantium]|uniref:RNA-guided endonuclease InsQ/TnpB family protein n=1 Tax=Selenomonas ruminantium TaxID=971 RepID=UPI001569949C|nr:RNA-guided endonuclease TnpB family protein [Selenomonas ruminantium]